MIENINMKIVTVVLLMLFCVSPALAGDLGFSDFMPTDPIQDLKDIGVWELVKTIIWLVVLVVVIAVVVGLMSGIAKTALYTAANNSAGKTDAMLGMFYIIGAVLLMVLFGGILIYVWNGLS